MGLQAAPIRRSARLAGTQAGAGIVLRQARRALSTTPLKGVSTEHGASKAGSKRQRSRGAPPTTAGSSSRPRKGAVSSPAVPAASTTGTLARAREHRKREDGFGMVIGVDEAGRGPFAGPVVAAACFVPPSVNIPGIQDSKKVSQHTAREALYKELTEAPGVRWATSEIGSQRIDEINILEATKEAMANCALQVCAEAPEGTKPFVFVDGNFTPPGLDGVEAECVIGGDSLEYCIAAASIIAKVTRDRLMIKYGERWPVFGFEKHKGYGTAGHRNAIREHGVVEIHRRSFLKKMEAAGGKLDEYRE